MAGVMASLVSVVLFVLVWMGVSIKALAGEFRAARRMSGRLSPQVAEMSRWCSSSDLAEIDQALDRVLEDQQARRAIHSRHGADPGLRPR